VLIVLDYLLQSKPPPGWLSVMIGWIGQDKSAVLNFAVLAAESSSHPCRGISAHWGVA